MRLLLWWGKWNPRERREGRTGKGWGGNPWRWLGWLLIFLLLVLALAAEWRLSRGREVAWEGRPWSAADQQAVGTAPGHASGGASSSLSSTSRLTSPLSPSSGGELRPTLAAGRDPDVFLEYRLQRERERSEQRELLQNLARDGESDPSLRAAAREQLLQLYRQERAERELERLLEARGLPAVFVTWSGEAVAVLVAGRRLTTTEVAEIGNLTGQVTGVPLERITISERGFFQGK